MMRPSTNRSHAPLPDISRGSRPPDHQAADAQNTYPLDLSVVIPAYKSHAILPVLVSRLEAVLLPSPHRYEILLIDDGSMDDTWNTIDQLTRTHDNLRGISLTRNYGQHNALLCGIRAAHGAVIVTMDDDLQHSPEDIPKLLAEIAKGYDVVYGTPVAEQHGMWRNMASQVTKIALQVALGVHTARSVSAFRAIRTSLRDCFADYRAPSVSIDVLLSWGTTHISALPVHHAPRHSGTSHYSVGRLLVHAFNMITGYSGLPLRMASLMGFAMTLFGIGILGYVVVRYFWLGNPVPGFPFLASIIVIFSGAQLFSIGIIGEYVARLHFRMMDRPTYHIRQETTVTDAPRT
jgi:glycosyltransferase involved in cell wall biosynthesis